MSALSSEVDLGHHLRAIRREGAAFVEQALTEPFRRQLDAEVSQCPFQAMAEYEGRARQGGELFTIGADDMAAYPSVRQLQDQLVSRLWDQGSGIAGVREWRPNEVAVQRYPEHAVGITPHLDLKRYAHLVAVFTAQGTAPFTICANRDGDALARWEATPGSLVLMRGPGFAGDADGRPLHMVGGPVSGHRISVTFRMNTRPER